MASYPISKYVDRRGWSLIADHCHASVMGSTRTKQCSRKATTKGRIRYGLPSLEKGELIPLCTQHAGAPNVVDLEAM